LLRLALRRLRRAAARGGKALGRGDGALQGHEDRDVSPVVAELLRALRARGRRLRRAQAGHSSVAEPHARADRGDAAAAGEGAPGGALLRPQDAGLDRPGDRGEGAGAASLGGRGEGGHDVHRSLRLRCQARHRGPGRGHQVMDYTILHFLAAPFVASLILTGIHAYLGVHVVERGVIFVDLSLAQIAALGAAIALIVTDEAHGPGVYWISLAFTFIGAAVFATIRSRRARIPQE